MDARSKAGQSSLFARFKQSQRPVQGKSTGSLYKPLQFVRKAHGSIQSQCDSSSHSRSCGVQMSRPTFYRDNAPVLGREVGIAEPFQLSQVSALSQNSVIELHESSSIKSTHSMMQQPGNFPTLRQPSLSNDSSNSSSRSERQQCQLSTQHRFKSSQQSEENEELSHCDSSTYNNAYASTASMPVPGRSVQSKVGPRPSLLQRISPRRIGSSATPLLQKPGQHSPVARNSRLPSNHLPNRKVWQNSPAGVAVPGSKASSSMDASSEKNPSAESESKRLSHLQAELKDFVDKSMESFRAKSTELDQKKSQLEEESRNRQKEQDELFQGQLHELGNAFDSKAVDLDQLFHEKKSHLENEMTGLVKSVREAGTTQMQRMSDYSQATLKKFHGAAIAAESFLQAYKQKALTEAIQALPGMIRPMLSQMMSSMLPSILTEAMIAVPTPSDSGEANSSSMKSPCIRNEPSVPASNMDPGSRQSSNTKRCRAASSCDAGPFQTTAATGPNKRLRRSKRIKDTSDKENLTPTSLSGRNRPCVTPGGFTNEEHLLFNSLSISSPPPKKSSARGEPKDASTRSNKKRKISSGKSSVTPLCSKTVPKEVQVSEQQETSPLSQLTVHQSERKIARPKGSTLKRDKRRKSYGKAKAPKKTSLANYLSDDTFSFGSENINP